MNHVSDRLGLLAEAERVKTGRVKAPSTTTLTDVESKVAFNGDWDILKTLGEGTFGKVRLCQHNLTGERVAIKSIQKANINTTKQNNSVKREVFFIFFMSHSRSDS
jgi:MAP/microtubule affinity-regulating kinase